MKRRYYTGGSNELKRRYTDGSDEMKRCIDCKHLFYKDNPKKEIWQSVCQLTWGMIFYPYKTVCDEYKRKWWKFWRPK